MTTTTSTQQTPSTITPSYTAWVTREDGDWLAEVTDLPGVSTWATTFAGLDRNVREAIALAEDLPDNAEDTLAINWTFPPASAEINDAIQVAQRRRDLLRTQRSLDEQVKKAVTTLTQAGWSVRDQAALLSMSCGRVSQLANTRS